MVVSVPHAGLAQEEEDEGNRITIDASQVLMPDPDLVSGSSWLVTTGQDPRFGAMRPNREMVTNAGWDAIDAAPGNPSGVAFAPLVPFRSAAPAFSRNIIITRQLGLFPIQTEPHIAVDPLDPDHLVMGTIDYNFPAISSYTSFDGGETWDGPHQIRFFQNDFAVGGDPVVAFGQDGTVYITQISIGFEEFRIGQLLSSAIVSTLIVARSDDGGITWSDAVPAARSTVQASSQLDPEGRERGTIRSSFLDKQWLAVGPDPNNPDNDILYLAYTDFTDTNGILYADELPFLTAITRETTIMSVRSTDGGLTWSAPVPVSPTAVVALEGAASAEGEEAGEAAAANAQDDEGYTDQQPGENEGSRPERFVQGAQPAVMPDGTLVVAYYDSTNDGPGEGLSTILVASSTDAGLSFADPVQAGVFKEARGRNRTTFFRQGGLPAIAVGQNGEIYIVAAGVPTEKPVDDSDIYFLRSTDRGVTWDPPVRLNGDDTTRLQFFPAIGVSPNGKIHAMWGDMRDDPDEVRYHIYYTESQDGGSSWGFTLPEQGFTVPDTRVTDFPSNALRGFPGGAFLGDYFGLAATDEDVFLVWADTRLGEFGGPNQQIGFARRTAIAPPELFLNPPSGVAGRDVTIQGFSFQPQSNIAIDVGGVTITNLRSDDQGEFTTNIYMPVTGEGPRNVTAYDETGNVATASFYTEFGFDSIARELNDLRGGLGTPAAPTSSGFSPAGTPAASGFDLAGTPPAGATPVPAATPTAADDDSP